MDNTKRLAAVDLGSNSFRLELGVFRCGQFYRTDYLKETVRLGAGLDAQSCLSQSSMQIGWDCLTRFGQKLMQFEADEVCAVATQTLREAQNRDDFMGPAMQQLGHPIRVISGLEEAALIYKGVAQHLARQNERRLVLDIGGRSTELIVGCGNTPQQLHSCMFGSIAWSMRFFPDHVLTSARLQEAVNTAKKALGKAERQFSKQHWDLAYGSAGTINAAVDVLSAAGWPSSTISRNGLQWLQDQLLAAGNINNLQLAGLREDRKPIIAGGLSLLLALFEILGIENLHQSSGGLRHGLLLDMVKTSSHNA